MSRHDWYRNAAWTADAAQEFEAKLARARNKAHYLRVQATDLMLCEPGVALSLLERYFALGADLSEALAHGACAVAYFALGQVDDAFRADEAALARERLKPNIISNARTRYPYEIAVRGRTDYFARALAVIEEFPEKTIFALPHFKRNAAQALMLQATSPGEARRHAERALAYARRNHSGLERHPKLGLVSSEYDAMSERLRRFCEV